MRAGFVSLRTRAIQNSFAVDSRAYRLRRSADGRGEMNRAAAVAKLTAPTVAFEIIRDVMTWHGAYGYTRAAGLERGLRGVASYMMGAEGAQNIMRVIIARELLGRESGRQTGP